MKTTTFVQTGAPLYALAALLAASTARAAVVLVDPHTAVTATMDAGIAKTGNTWYEVGVNTAHPTNGLPTGVVASESDPLSTYEIQPAVGRNTLLLDASNTVGMVVFETPVALKGFSIAASDGNGKAVVTPTLEFTDGTYDTLASLTFQDWFNNTPILYTTGGRLNVDSNSDDSGGSNNPRVLANNVTNSVADAGKMVQAISFTWKEATGSSGTHTCIFGVSGDTNGMGHYTPIALTEDSFNQDMIVGLAEVSHNAYVQTNLVSDLSGASVTDTNLVNPWGIVTSSTSPFWVAANGTGLSTVYNSTGGVQTVLVTVPPGAGEPAPSHPTGIIFNSSTNFVIPSGTSNAPAHFIFATEEGTISAWASGSQAALEVDNSTSKAIYKGLALASIGTPATNYLYAANFRSGAIDVFDSNFKPVPQGPPLTTNGTPFTDTNLPAGFAPFNIQAIDSKLYVTYALVDTNNPLLDSPGAGNGYLDVYDPKGDLLKRLASGGPLNSPWGLAMAPDEFGPFSGALLVGNFGDGRINAFDASLGTFLGPLLGTKGTPLVNEGLWGLTVGNGSKGGDTNTLYFTAGIPGSGSIQDHGLLGAISFQTNQVVGVPWELLQKVNGYQDLFTTAKRNANWVPVGPGGDLYVQTNGVLQVSVSQGDPNHLLYMGPGASNSVQEVLARLRIVAFGSGDPGRGGVCVGTITNLAGAGSNPATNWSGININTRNNADVTPAPNYHFRMLDDLRSWGPQLNLVWTNNVWYWMRLRLDPKADGTNDYFGKVWPADGSTPEPADWQMAWNAEASSSTKPVHFGYAGITGCSSGGLAQFEVDYVLIKSPTLPSITANFGPLGLPSNPPVLQNLTLSTNRNITATWFGGYLQSAGDVTGPWSTLTNTPSPYAVQAGGTNKFYRVQQ